ncbi:hypothetical protein J45TS6_32080 [Paenibacillus sp. J45TS6]|nr:hypothetical protein J45TS6_32080 [Paenibacillus sp. J45TS6]
MRIINPFSRALLSATWADYAKILPIEPAEFLWLNYCAALMYFKEQSAVIGRELS